MTKGEQLTRGDLPHWYMPGHAHFVTYRLADLIPHARLERWRQEREVTLKSRPLPGISPGEHKERAHKAFFAKYDQYLDAHANVAWLSQPEIATVVRDNLYHHHSSRYELLAWCIMPNHVHVLLQPFELIATSVADAASVGRVRRAADAGSVGHEITSDEVSDSLSPLSKIMHSLKSYTANRANELLVRSGRFWQKESYDHWVRDLDELQNIVDYIVLNPVRAGLCDHPHEFKFSSAFDRFERDKSKCGLVSWLRDDWRR